MDSNFKTSCDVLKLHIANTNVEGKIFLSTKVSALR